MGHECLAAWGHIHLSTNRMNPILLIKWLLHQQGLNILVGYPAAVSAVHYFQPEFEWDGGKVFFHPRSRINIFVHRLRAGLRLRLRLRLRLINPCCTLVPEPHNTIFFNLNRFPHDDGCVGVIHKRSFTATLGGGI